MIWDKEKDETDYKAKYEFLKDGYEALEQNLSNAMREHDMEVTDLKREHEFKIRDLKKENELSIKDMQFKIDHLESEELKAANTKISDLKLELAVAKETVVQLEKVVDLSADIIDVGEVVNKLIEKLPSLNISTLSLSAPAKEESKK